jgi:hypothetical protein
MAETGSRSEKEEQIRESGLKEILTICYFSVPNNFYYCNYDYYPNTR